MNRRVTVVGGGLAGSEAAWQLARRGIEVLLLEMRPLRTTPAHTTEMLAEVVCSNSFGADGAASPAGILKNELRRLNRVSLCADESRVPAGKALAVGGKSSRERSRNGSNRFRRSPFAGRSASPCPKDR